MRVLGSFTTEIPAGIPREFRIFPFGKVETTKGTFLFTPEDAQRVLQAWRDWGNRLSLDYEHQALEPVANGPTPAAGWFDLEVRPDGLWAVNVEWTSRALELLRNREYRYFSPAFRVEDGHIVELINIALTNLPATKRMEPLVAKAVPFRAGEVVDGSWDADAAIARVRRWASRDGSGEKDTIDWEKYRQAFAWYDASDPENFGSYKLPHHDVRDGELVVHRRGVMAAAAVLQGARGGVDIPDSDMGAVKRHIAQHYHQWGEKAPWEKEEEAKMTRVLTALGVEDEVAALEAIARLRAGLAEVVALTGKEDPQEALGVVRAWKEAARQVEALTARVRELEAEREAREREELIRQGKEAGKLTPALEKWAREVDLKTLKGFLEAAPRIVGDGVREPAHELSLEKWNKLSYKEKERIYRENPDLYRRMQALTRRK
jgi:phage I-like protein